MNSVGLIVAEHKPEALPAAAEAARWFLQNGVAVRMERSAAEACGGKVEVGDEEFVVQAEMVIVFGGDGTFLGTARKVAPLGKPLLGVYVSGFGFLTEISANGLRDALQRLLRGEYEIEERIMLAAEVCPRNRPRENLLAMNDITIRRSSVGGMLDCRVSVDENFVANYRGDGLIVCTPTGSTAYSLSADGPVVHPSLEAIVLTPLCLHTLNIRPLVIPATAELTVEVVRERPRPPDVFCDADAQQQVPLRPGDRVTIRRAEHSARFVRMARGTFYDRLRQKLRWGAEI